MKLFLISVVFVLACASAAFGQLQIVGQTDVLTIAQGKLQGLSLSNGNAYLGIPYAAQPVGNLRWQPTQPAVPFPAGQIFNASRFGPSCPQQCELPPLTCPLDGYSEACLSLDVYTPLTGSGHPVMLFYYGGDYVQGGAGVTLYAGLQLVNQSSVVLVVINYRLGALGFLHTRDLLGNFAVTDQTEALRWTRNNIAAFGGDPNAVTIFGQSAGAMSVASQLVSPPSYGLYQAAIIESNPLALAWSTEENALLMADKFAAALGCSANDTACLLAADVDDILVAQNQAYRLPVDGPLQIFVAWLPWLDGKIIADNPLTAFASGNYNRVPVTIGTVQSEGVLFVYTGFPKPVPRAEYLSMLSVLFRQHAPAIVSQYPCLTPADCRPALSDIGTDYIFACPTRNATRMMQQWQPQVHLYHFDHLIDADGNYTNIWGPMYAECQYEICHASELPFVFGSMENQPSPYLWGPGEAQFSRSMSAYWGNFANSRNPNSPLPVPTNWPAYTAADDTVLRMYYDDLVNFPLEKGYLQTQCDYWDSIGYSWGTFYQ